MTIFEDLGVSIDQSLSFENHINKICAKANQRSALIFKWFTSREPALLVRAFITYVRPLLEYASCVWSPFQLHFIDKIESVQRRFSKRLHGLSAYSYDARLAYLGIERLEVRRLKADLIMYYKILHNFIDVDSKMFFSLVNSGVTRGHPLKLKKPLCCTNSQLNNFSCRAINVWNRLDVDIVMAINVNNFKSKLNLLNFSNDCKRTVT